MSLEGFLAGLTQDVLLEIVEEVATAASAGLEHAAIKDAVRAKITDPKLIPAELRRIRDEAINQMGT